MSKSGKGPCGESPPAEPVDTLDGPGLIVAESRADCEFFCELLDYRGMIGDYDVNHAINGRSAFKERLKALKVRLDPIVTFVIVRDWDDDGLDGFNDVCHQVGEALPHVPLPTEPNKPSSREDGRSATVLMMPPSSDSGCLETLVLRVLCDKFPDEAEQLDAFVEGRPYANATAESKARLAYMVAAVCTDNPVISVGALFKHPEFRDCLGSAHFDPVIQVLKDADA